jgi:hypothetical protein
MKKPILNPLSLKLRNQYASFEDYVNSHQLSLESRSQNTTSGKCQVLGSKSQSFLQTSGLPSRDFKMRAFTRVSEAPRDLVSRSHFFRATSTQNLTSRSARQFCSTTALHEGVNSQTGNFYSQDRIQEVKEELIEENDEHVDIEEFISSLWLLNDLKFDLRLTYDLAHSDDLELKETDDLGFFFNIQESLKEIMNQRFGETVETSEFEVVESVDKFLKFVRELIRSVRRKGQKDSGILIEMIFRCFLKLIDSIFRIHSENIESLKLEHSNNINMQMIARAVELEKVQEQFKEKIEKLKEEILELNLKIKLLEEENLMLNDDIVDKEIKISKLTEVDFGFGAMKSMDNLLKNLNLFINDAKIQKKQNQAAMINIGEFFDTAKNIVTPIKYKSQVVQTDCFFKNCLIRVPLLEKPILSKHPLFSLDFEAIQIEAHEVQEYFMKSLLEFKPFQPFFYYFCANFFKNSELSKQRLFSVIKKLEKIEEPWAGILKIFLQLQQKLPKFVESEIFYIVSSFTRYNNKQQLVNNSLSVEAFLSFVDKTFPPNVEFRDFLLKNIPISSKENFSYHPSTFDSFCLKFAILFEKTKKNLKSSLEKISDNNNSKKYSVSQEKFHSFLNSKVKLKVPASELEEIWEKLSPGLDDQVHISVLFQHLRFLQFSHISKKSIIQLLDFLTVCFRFLTEKWTQYSKVLQSAFQEKDLENAEKMLNDAGILISNEGFKLASVKVQLGEDLSEVVDSTGFTFRDFNRNLLVSSKVKAKKGK